MHSRSVFTAVKYPHAQQLRIYSSWVSTFTAAAYLQQLKLTCTAAVYLQQLSIHMHSNCVFTAIEYSNAQQLRIYNSWVSTCTAAAYLQPLSSEAQQFNFHSSSIFFIYSSSIFTCTAAAYLQQVRIHIHSSCVFRAIEYSYAQQLSIYMHSSAYLQQLSNHMHSSCVFTSIEYPHAQQLRIYINWVFKWTAVRIYSSWVFTCTVVEYSAQQLSIRMHSSCVFIAVEYSHAQQLQIQQMCINSNWVFTFTAAANPDVYLPKEQKDRPLYLWVNNTKASTKCTNRQNVCTHNNIKYHGDHSCWSSKWIRINHTVL